MYHGTVLREYKFECCNTNFDSAEILVHTRRAAHPSAYEWIMPPTCKMHPQSPRSSPPLRRLSRSSGCSACSSGACSNPCSSHGITTEELALQPGILSTLRLRGLDLGGSQGGGTGAARALSLLLGRVPLVLLDLKNCHITDAAALALAPGLAGCTCLVALTLARTDDQ